MVWVVAVIACIILAIKYRRFRWTLFATVGLIALAVVLYIARNHQEEESSKHLVRTDQLVFTDLGLAPATYGSGYKLTGRVKNNSPSYVFQVKAKFHILDCDVQSHCDVVGEEEEWNICPLIPPGQVRDVDESIYFGSGTRVRGQFQWNYEITEIRARSTP
jgi:hypothetical protein